MRAIEFDFGSLHTDVGDSRFHVRGTAEWDMRVAFIATARDAFLRPPDLAARQKGKRDVQLGSRGGSRTSLFPSKKNARAADVAVFVPMESRLEQAYALCLERNPSVIAYRTQAIEVPVPGGRSHLPDFLICDDGGRVFVREIKLDKTTLKMAYIEKTAWVREYLARMGVDYQIIDRADLPSECEQKNLKRIHNSYTTLPTALEIELANSALHARLPCTYSELVDAFGDIAKHLIFTGQLRIDWQRPITPDTEVSKWMT